jgi:hypothetical protein
MMVSNCPRCNESFRVPAGELPEDAYAECPWCLETFPISDVLNRLPPIMGVMSADGQPIQMTLQAASAGPVDQSLGGQEPGLGTVDPQEMEQFAEEPYSESPDDLPQEMIRADADDSWSASTAVEDDDMSFQIRDPQEAPGAEAIAPMRVSPMPALTRKKKKRGIGGIIGVAIGGLLALPLAGLILWLVGFFGYGPFAQLPEPPARSAATPVDLTQASQPPGQPLGMSLTDDPSQTPDPDPADAARAQIMEMPIDEEPVAVAVDATEFNPIDSVPMEADPIDSDPGGPLVLPSIDPPQIGDVDPPEFVMPKEDDPSPPSEDPIVRQPPTTIRQPESVSTTPVDAALAPPSSSELAPPIASEPAPPSNLELSPPSDPGLSTEPAPRPPVDSAQTIAAAETAAQMIDSFSPYTGPETDRTRRLLLTYQQIAATCGLATNDGEAVRGLAAKIKSSHIMNDIERIAGEWLIYGGRTTEGIALIGRPSGAAEAPAVTLESGKVLSVEGDAPLPSGPKVLVLGAIVDGGSSVRLVYAEALP